MNRAPRAKPKSLRLGSGDLLEIDLERFPSRRICVPLYRDGHAIIVGDIPHNEFPFFRRITAGKKGRLDAPAASIPISPQ